MKISEFLTLSEATKSPNAQRFNIDNLPGAEELENMKYTATELFDPVRRHIGGPLYASSFFRSEALNAITPGASMTSQHMTGEAVDMDADVFKNGTNLQIFNFIKDNLDFDQLILEYPNKEGRPSWIHASIKRPPRKNRRQVLVKLRKRYVPFDAYEIGDV